MLSFEILIVMFTFRSMAWVYDMLPFEILADFFL